MEHSFAGVEMGLISLDKGLVHVHGLIPRNEMFSFSEGNENIRADESLTPNVTPESSSITHQTDR